MCKIQKTSVENDTGIRVQLARLQAIIALSITYNNDAKTSKGLPHRQEYRQLHDHRNQRPSKACGDIQKPHGQAKGEEGQVKCLKLFLIQL